MAFLGLWALFAANVTAAQDPSKEDLGRYIVVLKDSVKHPGDRARAQTEQQDGKLGFVYSHALNGYSAVLPEDALSALRQNPSVLSIEPDVRGQVASQAVPTGIDRVYATANEALDIDGKDDYRVNADVAVLDTGIDAGHPDLDVVSQVNCTESFPAVCKAGGADGHGHGTHVAGTVAAIDNGEGVVGVAPGARLWSVKVLNDEGEGSLSWYIAGIDWVTANASQIEVANSSLAFLGAPSSEAFSKAIENSLNAGVVHVVAAGNFSETAKYLPGSDPNVITVSALNDADGKPGGESGEDPLASLSNFGSVIDVAAPGINILSTLPGNEYGLKSGTSMASPHVAGAAAIYASLSNPQSREDVEDIRGEILEGGNFRWVDTSKDGVQEPLLDLSELTPKDPTVITEAATSVKASGATLRAAINPRGSATTYQFEYGPTTSYGTKAPVSPKSVGSGTSLAAASETVSGLNASTTYHYRVAATNEFGTAYGADKTLTTAMGFVGFSSVFGSEGSGNGQFVNPAGLAVDAGDHLFVADTYNNRIQKFSSAGAYVSKFSSGLSAPSDVDVGSNGSIYVADSGNNRIQKFDSAGTYQSKFGSYGTGNGQFNNPVGIAIDSNNHIWVADYENQRIQEFDETGKYLSKFGSEGSGNGQFFGPRGIAIDSSNHVWVIDESGRVQEFNSKGEYLSQFGIESVALAVAIDSSDRFWVTDSEGRVQVFNSEGEYLTQFGSEGSGEGQFIAPSGIVVDSKEQIWVSDFGNNRIQRWLPGKTAATTEAATSVKSTGATLNATVNPGGAATTYQFEYGTTTSYGTKIPASPKSVGSGTSPVAASEAVSGLSSGTTYHYRVKATNEFGTSYGADKTLTTTKVPTATTEAATSVKSTGATLNATVNPGGAATTYQFEYGTTTSYGTKIPASPKSVGSGASPVAASEAISGLSANTTYHYRVRATNEVGTTYGADNTLTTTKAGIAFEFAFGTENGHSIVPRGMAFDTSGNLLVADEAAYTLQKFSPAGVYMGSFGSGILGGSDVDVSSYNYIYVAESENNRIQVFNGSAGSVAKFGSYGTGNGQFNNPVGIAIDSNNHIWVADYGNQRIQEFDETGKYLSKFGSEGSGNGQFFGPRGIAIDSSNHVWVIDESGRVQEFNGKGEYLSKFSFEGSATAIDIDSKDRFWITDESSRVVEFDSEGEYVTQFGSEGSGEGQFSVPSGIVVDSKEQIWVADTGNNRIQRWGQ